MNFWRKLFGRTEKPTARIATAELLEAARTDDIERVNALLKCGASVISWDSKGVTALGLASMNGHREVVELLLANRADPDGSPTASASFWRPPVFSAALNGHKEVVNMLIANRARVDYRDSEGRTALHEMAASGNKEMAELLLSNKADVNAEDRKGMTPLCYAEAKGYDDVARLLRLHGGRVPSEIQSVTMPINPVQAKIHRSVAKARELAASGGLRVEGMGHEIGIEISLGGSLWDGQAAKEFRSKVGHTTKWFPNEHCGSGQWRLETGCIYENNIEQVPEMVEYALHSLCDAGFLNDAQISWIDYSREYRTRFDENDEVKELSRTQIWPI